MALRKHESIPLLPTANQSKPEPTPSFTTHSPLSQTFTFPTDHLTTIQHQLNSTRVHQTNPAHHNTSSHHESIPSNQIPATTFDPSPTHGSKPSLTRLLIGTSTTKPSSPPSPPSPTSNQINDQVSPSRPGGRSLIPSTRPPGPIDQSVHPSELDQRLKLPQNAHTDVLANLRTKLDGLRHPPHPSSPSPDGEGRMDGGKMTNGVGTGIDHVESTSVG